MLAAVLDTCVLYSGLRRDFLLSLVATGCYRIVLTEDILEEIEDVEARKLIGRGRDSAEAATRARYLTQQIRSAFELECESRVSLVSPVGLPDEGDEHLVAAAVAGHAEVIVTENVRALPEHLLPSGIRVLHPRDFLHDMVCVDPELAAHTLSDMSGRRRTPPQSRSDLIDLLLMKNLMKAETASMLRQAIQRNCRARP